MISGSRLLVSRLSKKSFSRSESMPVRLSWQPSELGLQWFRRFSFFLCGLGSLPLHVCFLFLRKAVFYIKQKRKKKTHNSVIFAFLKMRTKVFTPITYDLFRVGFKSWPLLVSFPDGFQNIFLVSWFSKSKKLIYRKIFLCVCEREREGEQEIMFSYNRKNNEEAFWRFPCLWRQ